MIQVTAITAAYNAASYIENCIQSVLAQTVPCRMVIVDDASLDDTYAIAMRYAEEYPDRITVLKNEQNAGAAASRNRAVACATTPYVAILDADDWWEKGKLKAQTEVMEQTGCAICSTGRELMTPDGRTTGKYIPVKERITYRELLKHNSINCSSVLLRREDALAFPMEHDDSHEDYITWLRILRKGGFAAGINRPYLKYRLSEGGKSRNKLKSAAMTYQVYRYVGYGPLKSLFFFASYALHGIWKYR